jgi:Raf kinase inhibitor-like YbhB/YbcL family protein
MRRRRFGSLLALGAVVTVAPMLAACDTNDGRDMRPPSSYEEWVLQNTTPSTSTTTTTLPPETLPPTTVAVVASVAETTTADSTAGSAADGSDAAVTSAVASADAVDATLPVDTFAESLGLGNLADDGVEFTGPWPTGADIPVEYTCNGEDNVPLLTWTAPPAGTAEMALVVTDESADEFAHWIVIGLPAEAGSVGGPEPIVIGAEATNSGGDIGWAGPCPPDPDAHTYRFTLYALSQAIELPPESLPADLVQAIEASATGVTSFTGTYQVA